MKRILLVLVFSLVLLPGSVFAEKWIEVPNNDGKATHYYDIDSYGVANRAEYVFFVRIKMPIDPVGKNAEEFVIDGEKADYIIYLVEVNSKEKFYTLVNMELAKGDKSLAKTVVYENEEMPYTEGSIIDEVLKDISSRK